MKSLKNFLLESLIVEGGASGHMKHIVDYDELTLDDLKALIYNLFNGRIEDITEKVDGTNIQASMNAAGEVVFIRNKGDLNSERGGMTIDDMVSKWADKPSIQKTFVESGRKIEEVFGLLPKKFFNPNANTRVFANCECLTAGTTNIMPYVSSNVMFHDLWVYERTAAGWEHIDTTKDGLDQLDKATETVDGAQITPKVIIDTAKKSDALVRWYMAQCNNIFKSEKLKYKNTIADYKHARFKRWLKDNASWALANEEGIDILYNRIINGIKTVNIRDLKKLYPGNESDIDNIEKNLSKDICKYVIEDLDELFLKMSNELISITKGFINDGHNTEVVQELQQNLDDVVKDIMSDATTKESTKTKLCQQLDRLAIIDNKLNAAEGIVFKYKGKLMKCTGFFGPLNQILGSLKYNR